jgi:4-nitrophenyl phosphatase
MTILDRYAGLIVDLDGVVFRGDEPLRGASAFLKRVRKSGTPVVFVTNNSTRTPDEWVALFDRHRMQVDPDRVLSSAVATARLLRVDKPRCYVIGEYGLRSALKAADVPVVDTAAGADAVVVGWDKTLSFDKLKQATLAISRGARFVGTNPDTVYPSPEGPWPGNGATLAYLRAATGVAPEVVGKPLTPLFEMAGQLLGVDGDVLVVGDQVATDVTAAEKMGWDAALVLSGVAGWTALVDAPAQPAWVVPDLTGLVGPEPPVVRRAREGDLSSVRGLLQRAGLDVDGAAARLQDTLVAETSDGIVGTAAWEMVESAAHLRGITVAASERGHGTGSHLVVRALDELAKRDVAWVYLLTPGADELFEKLGFWRVHRDRVPEEILTTAQYGAEGSGAVALVRRLRG